MSKATLLASIASQITNAVNANAITPTIVGNILSEAVNLDNRPYKVASFILSQTGTAAPTVVVLENTFGVGFTWSRNSVGDYKCTAPSDVFDVTKLFFSGTPQSSKSIMCAGFDAANAVYLQLQSWQTGGDFPRSDEWYNESFEFRQYL